MTKPTILCNPDGVQSDKPIALRLMPRERAAVEEMALAARVSHGYLARRALINGIAEAAKELGIQVPPSFTA